MDDYDCVRCGACCVSDYDAVDYVHLLPKDLERLTPVERKYYVHTEMALITLQHSMKTRYDSRGNCCCKALEGTVGAEVSCGIYDRRPEVCQKFDPGTDVCDFARQAAFGVELIAE